MDTIAPSFLPIVITTTIVAIFASPNFIPGNAKNNVDIEDSTILRTILIEIIKDRNTIFLVFKLTSSHLNIDRALLMAKTIIQ